MAMENIKNDVINLAFLLLPKTLHAAKYHNESSSSGEAFNFVNFHNEIFFIIKISRDDGWVFSSNGNVA